MRTIDADALKGAMFNHFDGVKTNDVNGAYIIRDINVIIDNAPTVELVKLDDGSVKEKMRSWFVASPTEVVKIGEPLSNSDEINKALEKGEIYKRGYEDAKKEYLRPKGEWKLDSLGAYCSECGTHPDYSSNFCPKCGAKMKGGVE